MLDVPDAGFEEPENCADRVVDDLAKEVNIFMDLESKRDQNAYVPKSKFAQRI